MKQPPKPQPTAIGSAGLALMSGGATIGIGISLAIWAIARALADGPTPPMPLTIALVATGALQIGLGVGLLQRSRTAWSFAISLDGVLLTVGLFALPAIAHARSGAVLSAIALAAVGGTISLLISAKSDF